MNRLPDRFFWILLLLALMAGNARAQLPWEVVEPLAIAPPAKAGRQIIRLDDPVSAKRLRVSMTLQASTQGPFSCTVMLLATTDANPSSASAWKPMFPASFAASQGQLTRSGDGIELRDFMDATQLGVDAGLPANDVTGLAIDIRNLDGNPTELRMPSLRVERATTLTTNVALGCAVQIMPRDNLASSAGFLTDGQLDDAVSLDSTRHFVVDLKQHRDLDHVNIRLRSTAMGKATTPGMRLEVYDSIQEGASPVWRSDARAQAVSSAVSNDSRVLIRATGGEGVFAGRYLKLSAVETQALLEVTEIEAYETMVPLGVVMTAQGRSTRAASSLTVPAGATWMTFAIEHPELEDTVTLGRHWRILGFHDEWLAGTGSAEVESRCPPPGEYEFQAQIRQSDGEWGDAKYRVPLIVPVPFWQRGGVLGTAALLAIFLAAALAWFISRRIMARRVAELERRNELSNERARIARDMHDAVGSQLTQLAVMHEIVAEELALDDTARGRLQQLTDTARSSVAALDAVVWAVNPKNDNLANMAGYLTQVAREYLTPMGIACRQDVPHEWPEKIVSSHARHEIHLAFKEALQNVVKHAQATEVALTMRHADGRFTATIADNGTGLPADLEGLEKNGLDNMQQRLASLGGHCRVQDLPGGGTLVELQVPL
ncbi:ATP-binding protein [Roseimicrobium sp. ORNL1]|uniref:ATP-binding protein n=1 Tax=Roseimicrobium sp. ORNL1 TaxID=2711231 RepID=UPI0013E14DC1|nr:ATP-binding protein [Roseimicrobium sp. ORNL1]QIF04684.1 histidine kinase [Roseimicrobium sp. ORNL1]